MNCSYNTSKENVSAGSSLTRKWYYSANVSYSNGTIAENVNVTAYNVSSNIQFSDVTNSSGYIYRKELVEYVNSGGTRVYYNNYTIF